MIFAIQLRRLIKEGEIEEFTKGKKKFLKKKDLFKKLLYGIKFIRISEYNGLDDKIDEVLNFNGPVLCEVMVSSNQKIIPTVSSRVNADGSMSSRPLEDMYPFLDRDEYKKNLYVDEV